MDVSQQHHSLPEPKIHHQHHLGLEFNPDCDDSIKQIVTQLHNLSLQMAVNGGDDRSGPIHEIDDEEIKLKQAFDEELYNLTVKQAISEALQDQYLKQAIDREIAAIEGGDDGVHDHSLRRFIDDALQSNSNKAEEYDAKVEGNLEVITVKEMPSSNGVDQGWGDEGIEGGNSKDGNENRNGCDGEGEIQAEVEIETNRSNRGEYEKEGSNGWGDNNEEYQDNTYEEYKSENVKEVGYNVNDYNGEDSGGSKDDKQMNYHYPLRPDAEDCSYYMRTGMCKFGSNCKFNHPLTRKNQGPQATKGTGGQRDESSERPGQIECKYYLTPVGCKYGNACKYKHSKGKPPVAPIVEFNFLGLPIRAGEKECPFYMRTGSCKYGSNCRFNHPDPKAAGGGDTTPSNYNNGGSVPLQSAPKTMSSWSSPRAMNETTPFVPVLYPPNKGLPSPNHDWNDGYQAPIYPPSETGLPTPPAFVMNNRPTDTANIYPHHHQPVMVEDYPERPGEPECSYFLKTGDCKYRSNCRFHHPKNRIPKAPPCTYNDKGLPLRPGQNTCTYYSRYGICKFGPACKYDHPAADHNNNSTWSEPDEPLFGNSVTPDDEIDWK